MSRAHQLHTTLGNGASRGSLQLCADLVDDDDLRHVVLHRLDHHGVLQDRGSHLHASRLADGRMRDIAIPADLVRCIDDDDTLVLGQDTGHLAQHGGLAHAWASE